MIRDDFDRKYDYYESVRKDLGLRSIWSDYDVENLSERHPFEGADTVAYTDHWGEKTIAVPITGSTWASLFVAADACIRDSGDNHHVYVERFKPSSISPNVLFLYTGS